MLGQSVMWAIVTASLIGSPSPCVCELGEGSSSLNHPLNHCPVHQSHSTLRMQVINCDLFVLLVLGLPGCLIVNWKMVFVGVL